MLTVMAAIKEISVKIVYNALKDLRFIQIKHDCNGQINE